VRRQGSWNYDFSDYLEAKFAIDSASLNPSLYARFRDHLRGTVDPRVLDIGTGTGAMIRRILGLELSGRAHLIGVDQEERNLAAGVDRILRTLRDLGYRIGERRKRPEKISVRGRRGDREIWVELLQGDLLESGTMGKLEPFDFITAHAFMDLMPLQRSVEVIRSLLKAGGVFYSTLNYDGLTVLLPGYEEGEFEQRLLQIYNRSMECRRTGGRKTGGALSGRRLYRTLLEGGFVVLGLGSSDWNVFPSEGVYTEEQKLFLSVILSMIEAEARLSRRARGTATPSGAEPVVDPKRLADWYADRLEAVQNHRLCLIVHQLDLLAKRA
jgi:SAM-dependent methyltransferase